MFLGSEFKLDNIKSGVNFYWKNLCGNFFFLFRGNLFQRIAGKIANIANIRTRNNFVPCCSHIMFLLFNGQTEQNLNILGSHAAIAGKLAVLKRPQKNVLMPCFKMISFLAFKIASRTILYRVVK